MKSNLNPQEEEALIKAVRADLESVSKRNDNKLLLVLGVLVSLVLLYDRFEFKSIWLDYVLFISIPGVIGCTIYSVIRGKRKIAVKYGLTCPACGYIPRANMVESAADTQMCRRCGAWLNVYLVPDSSRRSRR